MVQSLAFFVSHLGQLEISGLAAIAASLASAIVSAGYAWFGFYRLGWKQQEVRQAYKAAHSIEIDGRRVSLDDLPTEVIDGLAAFERKTSTKT